LQSYERVADIATMIEMNPTVAVRARGWPNRSTVDKSRWRSHSNCTTQVILALAPKFGH
jgi:hypothetical protein